MTLPVCFSIRCVKCRTMFRNCLKTYNKKKINKNKESDKFEIVIGSFMKLFKCIILFRFEPPRSVFLTSQTKLKILLLSQYFTCSNKIESMHELKLMK